MLPAEPTHRIIILPEPRDSELGVHFFGARSGSAARNEASCHYIARAMQMAETKPGVAIFVMAPRSKRSLPFKLG